MTILVGTSGWYYKDWQGVVYPPGLAEAERLPFFAERMPTVEVNVTFYRTPSEKVVRGWVEKTKDVPRFEFSVKAPRDLTQDAMAKGTPDECARLAEAWLRAVVQPLSEAERLGAILLQLSPGVLHNRHSLARLERTLEALRGHPVAVEFRNATWLEGEARDRLRADARALLDAHDAALVAVDGPSWPNMLFEGDASHAFVRFHGRNADVWRKGRVVENDEEDPRMNRYDYKYSPDALRPWAKQVKSLAKEKTVRTYFNNHPYGQAYHDAQTFQDLVEAPQHGPQSRLARFG